MTDTAGPQFALGGHRNGNSPYFQGAYGIYWSSSAYTSTTHAYDLFLDGNRSTVNPADYSNKLYGISLRCLAKKGITTLNPSASQPVTLLENTKLSTITIIAILL